MRKCVFGEFRPGFVCPDISLTIDSYDLWFGGNLTVAGTEQDLGICTVTVYNDFMTETFDFGLGNYSSCVAMFNISTPGVYFVDSVCTLPYSPTTPQFSTNPTSSDHNTLKPNNGTATTNQPPTSSSGQTIYRCPEQRRSCLNGVSLLDSNFKDPSNPLTSYATQRLTILPNTTALDTCRGSKFQAYNWRMFLINGSDTIPVNLSQSDSAFLKVPAQTLVPGFYVVVLEVEINGTQFDMYDEDYLYVRVLLPELVSTIKGAAMRESNGSEVIVFDANGSNDPVTRSAITTDVIYTTWSVLRVSVLSYIDTVNCIASFPGCAVLESSFVTWYNVSDPHSSKYLNVDTSIFPNNSTVFVIFTISRGSRVASAIQSLYISEVVRPVNLSCLYNCRSSANNKMAYDKLELYLSEEDLGAKYTWSAMRLENNSFVMDNHLTTKLAVYNRTVYVSKSDIEQGMTYLFSVLMTVTVDGQGYQTRAGYMKTVNYQPYGGSCKISKTKGDATLEAFIVNCYGWLDEGERISRDPRLDTGAVLTYAVIQTTRDAYLEEETILVSIYRRMVFYLKPGDRLDDDRTNITVQIIDIYGDAATVTFNVQSIPTLDVTAITADEVGAQAVLDYMTLVQENIARLRSSNYDVILSVVTSAAEQLLQIPLPRKPAQIAKTVDGEEGVLLDIDLSHTNSSRSITFNEYYETSISSDIDPATFQIQQGFEYLSYKAYEILLGTVVNGKQSDNQRYLNQLTQCFNNMIAETEYASTVTKGYVVGGLRILSDASGIIWVDSDGLSAEEEEGENALVDMTAGTINSVVPNDLNQARTVNDIGAARRQIDDMVVIAGTNMTTAISDALISPSERAYLYLKVQEKLKYDLENVKDLARSSAASIVNISRNILSTTDLCLSCSKTVGTGLNRQKMISMTSSELGSKTLKLNTASVRLNSFENEGHSIQKVLMMQMEKNIFMYDSDSTSSQIVHGVTHLELADNAQVINTVTYEQTVDHIQAKLIEPVIDEEDASKFSYHKFVYRNTKDDLCLRLEPCLNIIEEYVLYISFSESPTMLDYDIKTRISGRNNWIACIKASVMNGHTGMNYLGVETKFKSTTSKEERTVYPCYEFSLVTMACLNWEEDSESWRNDQCKLEWKPDRDKVICVCNQIKHLTFGTSFFLAPNTIDFSTVFLKFSPLNQAAVIATICILFVIYISVVIWARRRDRTDIFLWGIKPLVDNHHSDRYFFILKVYTGYRLGSGTESQIAFRLSGDRHDTGVRILSDGIRKRFGKGSVMQFLMSTHLSLGLLTHLRIWHDNKGKGEMASWYLSKIVITDLQDNYSYTFLCEDWIAVENSNVSMDKLIFVADREYLESFNHRLAVRTKDRLIDGHLWTSILYRPTFSNFTRVQRATCAYMALMVTMLANAMYFNPEDNYETPASVEIGPFRFSLHQVLVALICAAISTIPTLLVIMIFNKSKRRIPDINDPTLGEFGKLNSEFSKDDSTISISRLSRVLSPLSLCRSTKYSEMPEEEYTVRTGADSKSQLPFWCSYIGWFLAIGGVLTSTFMILLYSMEWGKQKSEEWLSTFLLSMVQSVIVVDPIMIVAMAFFIAFLFKTLSTDDNAKKYSGLINMDIPTSKEVAPFYSEPPLRQVDLEDAKRKRSTEVRQRITVIEIISNLFWLWILLSISYSNRDDRTYRLHEAILNMMNRNPSQPFHMINNTAGFYSWLGHTAIPAMLPIQDYNGNALHWTDQQYIDDLNNFRIGPPRLRQLRVNTEPCNLPLIETDACYREYSYWTKETGDFCLSWHQPPCPLEESVYNHSSHSWKYNSAEPFSGVPLFGYVASYENGGYRADLGISRNISELIIEELFETTWIDRKTRAVILEFTVFCANVNLFAFSMFMVEFPDTGGALPSVSIFPVRVYHHVGPIGTYILICEVLALFYFISVFIRIGLQIFEHKCKFFKHFWILFDIGTAVISVHVVVFYAIRLYLSTATMSKFQQDKRAYVDFYQVAFYDKVFVVFLGILVFLSTLRCLRVLEGNKHVYIVANIFYKLANDLLWLGVTLVFVFVVFAILGCMLFGSRILSYINLYKALTTLFLTVIGKSKFTEINESDPILAKLYFTFFVFGVSLLMMSVFLSSLSACIEEISHGQTNVDDVFLMAIEKLLSVLRGKPPVTAKSQTDLDTYTIYSLDDTSIISELTLEDLDETVDIDTSGVQSNVCNKY